MVFLSLFEISRGEENFHRKSVKNTNFDFYIGDISNTYIKSPSRKLESKEVAYLTLKIYADEQYDYDQNLYLAEGNVKAQINGGILRSDLLSYDKSTGILSAEGNIRFSKGGQYFIAKGFNFNLLKKKGIIKDVHGILDVKNVLNDLKLFEIDSDSTYAQKKIKNNEINTYDDGIEFSFGNIKLQENKITRSSKSIGSINNWRFKSNLINIEENSWKSNKIIFTNDPFDPNQISFEGIDVIAEEDEDGKLLITSSKTNLILENRNKVFLGKRVFGGKKKKKNKIELMFDGKDRDGLILIRRNKTTTINDKLRIDFEPQFLINRAILGKTYSYKDRKNKNINFSDLFGINIKLKSENDNWNFDSINDLSTLNIAKFKSGFRHSAAFKKYFRMPIVEDSSLNIFTTYRSRAWNGTLGETEIKSAFGGFIEKTKNFKTGQINNNLNIRIGIAKYQSEKLESSQMINLWRSSIFASFDSEYPIWKIDTKTLDREKLSPLSPVLIKPELVLRTNINSAYLNYINSIDQGFLKVSLGPEIRLGKFEGNFFDYTKLSIMPGVKIKFGNSPFKFDNAIDFKTLNISLMQQIYGPLVFDAIANLNVDNNSKNYGEYYDTKLGLLWHKRSYECGIYYHPNNDAGGIYFRLNGFKFGNSVKSVF